VLQKQDIGQVFYSSAPNLDRFLWTGFLGAVLQTGRQNRIIRPETGPVTGFQRNRFMPGLPVLSKNLSEILFPVF
jgi:hypothetical protein